MTCYSAFCLPLEAFLVVLVLFQLSSWFFEQSVQAGQISISTILCPPGYSVDSIGLCEQIRSNLPTCPQRETVHQQPELSSSQSDDFTTYKNDTLGITIQYPFDLDLTSDVPFFDFAFILFDESAGLGVKIVDIPSSIDLDQICAGTYAILPFIIPGYQLITAGETSLSGYPAYEITFEGYLKEYKDIKVQTIFTVVNDKLYGIVYFAFKPLFEDYRSAAFQRMIDSFEII